MATGYVLNTPRMKRNGGRRGVTVVNGTQRRAGRRASILPPATGRGRTKAAWEENPKPRRKSRASSVSGRVVEKGRSPKARKSQASATRVTGRMVPNKKAGASARKATAARKTTRRNTSSRSVSGRVVKSATSRSTTSTRASRSTTAKKTPTRTRRQSRNAAGKSSKVAVKKNATKRTGRMVTVKVPAQKRGGKTVKKAYTYKRRKPATRRTVRRNATKRTGRMVRNAIPRWEVDVHPSTGKRGIRGQKMTKAEREKYTKRGVKRAKMKAERRERVGVTATKRRAPGVKGKAAAGHWKPGVMHPVTGRAVGGQKMSARDVKLFKTDGTTRKGVGPAAVSAAYKLAPKKAAAKKTTAKKKTTTTRRKTVAAKKRKPAAKKKTSRRGKRYRVYRSDGTSYLRAYPTKRRKPAKRKTAAKRKPAKRATRVKSYLRKVPGKKRRVRVKSYTRKKAPKRRTAMRRNASPKRRTVKRNTYMRRNPTRKPSKSAVWVKPYTRSDGVRVKGHWTKPAKGKKRAAARKPATRRTARPARYRVRKPSGGTYLRRYPTKRRKPAKRRTYARRRGGMITVRVPAKRSRSGEIIRKGYTYKRKASSGTRRGAITRNPYKRSKVRTKPYSYTRRSPKRKRVHVPAGRRSQWYPHSYGGKWVSQAKAKRLGMLTKREERAMMRNGGYMDSNPYLPDREQMVMLGKKVGVGAVGFVGAIAAGRALTNVTMLSQHTGNWTSVLGNVATGLGFWALASAMPENEKLQAMKPAVVIGAGIAAVVNTVLNLVGSQVIPADYAAWVMPGAGAAQMAPSAIVEPANATVPVTNGTMTNETMPTEFEAEGTSGFGQIDIYEAALNGVSGIEEELEMELDRMSGMGMSDGIFDNGKSIFSGLDGTGTPIEQAYAGMGAQVEEAYAGMNEYLEVPMSGMGAQVEEAYAGMGRGGMLEYLQVPMSGMNEYLEVPMGGMGAQVEEAYAGMNEYLEVPMSGMNEYLEVPMSGMGQDNGASAAAVEASIQNRPLMPGFRQAVQRLVRERIASGQPMDNAFYSKLGRAAANLARKKFGQRAALATGRPQDIPVEPWKAPLLRNSAPMYTKPVPMPSPQMVPGSAEPIPTSGQDLSDGIFANGSGIFDGEA